MVHNWKRGVGKWVRGQKGQRDSIFIGTAFAPVKVESLPGDLDFGKIQSALLNITMDVIISQ